MLKRLHLKNFTVFADADFEFVQGLNVLVGTNGTGKSHVLKVGYAAARVMAKIFSKEYLVVETGTWQRYLATRLKDVLQPVELGNLVRWNAEPDIAKVELEFKDASLEKLSFSFLSSAKQPSVSGLQPIEVELAPQNTELHRAIFIPPKEVLTMAWLLPVYRNLVLPVDDAYPSLLELLGFPPSRKLSQSAQSAIAALEKIVGGQIRKDGDRYYVVSENRRVEVNLVAEGIRKFAMLEGLLRNGILSTQSLLFWDEPEANLNPALLRKLAAILAELARQGFQIILATHSMSLLKEFHILSREKDAKPLPIKYFGLNAGQGEATRVVTTDNFEYLPDVVALAEELKQADELEDVFIRDDQAYHAQHRGEE